MVTARTFRSVVVAAAPVLVLGAACAGGEGGDTAASAPAGSEDVGRYFTTYLDEAVALGVAGPEQIAVLERAVENDGMPFEDLAELTRRTFDCFTGAGIDYTEKEPYELGIGYLLPDYTWAAEMPGKTLAEVEELGDACIDRHSYWASMAYQDERVVGEARDARLRRDFPHVVECLRGHGVDVPDDATLDEVRQNVEELAFADEPATCYDDFR